ncbi:hypothetical protein H6P81_019812 [Aristolochia fimbriata]|uniref:Uncharacterized protein n=1 Tax=Aristolochia fimbriata TaxID=158543 RepID=A0AAV7DWP7_ARIFI|nr:hypothetical protein H6P81_019812 [Aristolochia fimbriata]
MLDRESKKGQNSKARLQYVSSALLETVYALFSHQRAGLAGFFAFCFLPPGVPSFQKGMRMSLGSGDSAKKDFDGLTALANDYDNGLVDGTDRGDSR